MQTVSAMRLDVIEAVAPRASGVSGATAPNAPSDDSCGVRPRSAGVVRIGRPRGQRRRGSRRAAPRSGDGALRAGRCLRWPLGIRPVPHPRQRQLLERRGLSHSLTAPRRPTTTGRTATGAGECHGPHDRPCMERKEHAPRQSAQRRRGGSGRRPSGTRLRGRHRLLGGPADRHALLRHRTAGGASGGHRGERGNPGHRALPSGGRGGVQRNRGGARQAPVRRLGLAAGAGILLRPAVPAAATRALSWCARTLRPSRRLA